jgi:hypothetical protein
VHPARDIRNSLLPRDSADGSDLTDAIDVATLPLAEVLYEACDLLKLDIEGGEFELLAHGGDALRNARRVIAELHPSAGDPAEAVRMLEEAGFDVQVHESIHEAGYPSVTALRR